MTRSVTSNRSTLGGHRVRRVVLALLLLASLSLATSALAQVTAFQSAGGQVFRASGLDLLIDTKWVEGPGYIPVRITARQVGPSTSPRSIVVEFEHSAYRSRKTVVRQQIDVSVPLQSTTVCVPVPKWVSNYNSQYRLNVYEDGRRLKKLSGHYISLPATLTQSAFSEVLPSMLVIGPTSPDSSTLGAMYPGLYGNTVAAAEPLRTLATVKPADLPTEWIDYSCLDLVVISRDQLIAMANARPEAWMAIRHWVSAGGNIVVHGLGADWSGLDEIDSILAAAPPTVEPDGAIDTGWQKSTDRNLTRPLDVEVLDDEYDQRMWEPDNSAYSGGRTPFGESRRDPRGTSTLNPEDAERQAREKSVLDHVRSRRAGLGYVVAVADEELFPGDRLTWRVVLNTLDMVNTFDKLDENRRHWHERHGVSMVQNNDGFWEFLVPGVGHALVTEFRLLISLFVVLIGPVNYFLLRRRHKLHLIIFTTPASAAIVTIALMVWGLVADGIATRARARSYTHIDQRDGTAVCWSRLSFYAGIAPSGGLVFPRDVAVIPIRVADAESNSIACTTVWDDSQRLESGWLPSRTPTQFMTVRARRTAAGLRMATKTEGENDTPTIVVTNRLGTRADWLIVCDADGKLYAITEPLAPGKVRTLSQLSDKDFEAVIGGLRRLLTEHSPRWPEGFSRESRGRYRSQSWYGAGEEGTRVEPGSSRLERGYKTLMDGLMRSELRLAPRTYLAIVERSPEVVFGTDQAQEEASTHLVTGAW